MEKGEREGFRRRRFGFPKVGGKGRPDGRVRRGSRVEECARVEHDNMVAHADHIIVLDAGRILQHGSHAELVRQDGLYRRLWEIQNAVA